jgi:serine/threonine protein kinase
MSQDAAPALSSGRYRLVEVLGVGGMATVYRGYDAELDVYRAIKVLSPELAVHTKVRERFQREARTMAKLAHPHIVMVLDVGKDGERVYMVMEEVRGGSLRDRLDALGPLAPRHASGVLQQVLQALSVAHKRGIVHRDIKPGNILLTEHGDAKVTDFGIAQLKGKDVQLTRAGSMMGTLAFMAPEQRTDASTVDARADLYALGATLYTLVTGKESFDLFAAELEAKLFTDFPPGLFEVTRKASRYEPEDRYQSAGEMLEAMRAAHEHLHRVDTGELPLGAPIPGLRTGGSVDSPTLSPISLGSSSNPSQPEATIDYASFDETGARIIPERIGAEDSMEEEEDENTWAFEIPPHLQRQDDATPNEGEVAAAAALEQLGEETESWSDGAGTQGFEQVIAPPEPPPPPPARPATIPPKAPSPWGTKPDTLLPEGERSPLAGPTPPQTGPPPPAIVSPKILVGLAGAAVLLGLLAMGVLAGRSKPQATEASLLSTPVTAPTVATTEAATPATQAPASKTTRSASRPKASVSDKSPSTRTDRKSSPKTARGCIKGSSEPIHLNSRPFGKITIDGKQQGDTPWKGMCSNGTHTVAFQTRRGTKTHKFTVREGKEISLCWDFRLGASCSN